MVKKIKTLDIVEEVSKKLLELIGTDATINVSEDKNTGDFLVDVSSEKETGLLIGARGRTLESLQTIIGFIVKTRTGEWRRVVVNVGDWREKEDDRLKDLATSASARAKETGTEQALYNLTPSQRRIVHMALADEKGIKTESKGEGRERYLVVIPVEK